MNASVHFQGFPLLNLLSRNTSESLWRECGAQNVVPERCWEGWWMEQALMNSHKSLHTLLHSRKTPPHFSETRDLSELTECLVIISYYCYYLACSAYFGLGHRGFISLREISEESQGLILPRSSCAGDPGTAQLLSLSSSTAQALSPARDLPEIIDKNTSSYITILMCPCGGERAITLGWLTDLWGEAA